MISETQQLKNQLMKEKVFRTAYKKKMTNVIYRAGRMIREMRVTSGLSQHELAKRLKTHQPAIARIERGMENLNLKTLQKIAKSLDTILLPIKFESMKEIEDKIDDYLSFNSTASIKSGVETNAKESQNASYVMPILTKQNVAQIHQFLN